MAAKVNGSTPGSAISPSAPAALYPDEAAQTVNLRATMFLPQHDRRAGSFYEWICLVRIRNISARTACQQGGAGRFTLALHTKKVADAGLRVGRFHYELVIRRFGS
jgi:hypothetical protein